MTFVKATTLALLISWANYGTWQQGAEFGLIIGVGLGAMILASAALWESKSISLYLINTCCLIVNFMAMSVIIAGWDQIYLF